MYVLSIAAYLKYGEKKRKSHFAEKVLVRVILCPFADEILEHFVDDRHHLAVVSGAEGIYLSETIKCIRKKDSSKRLLYTSDIPKCKESKAHLDS